MHLAALGGLLAVQLRASIDRRLLPGDLAAGAASHLRELCMLGTTFFDNTNSGCLGLAPSAALLAAGLTRFSLDPRTSGERPKGELFHVFVIQHHVNSCHNDDACQALSHIGAVRRIYASGPISRPKSQLCWRSPTGLLYADAGNHVYKATWQMLELGRLLDADHYQNAESIGDIIEVGFTCDLQPSFEPCTCQALLGGNYIVHKHFPSHAARAILTHAAGVIEASFSDFQSDAAKCNATNARPSSW